MGKEKIPIMTDETGRQLVEKLHTHNMLLGTIAGQRLEGTNDIKEVRRIVQAGKGPANFQPGDQIIVPWTDTSTGAAYDVPLDVVHFGDATLQDGEIVPGMYLQWHYATPFEVQFDNYEAFYYAREGLAAGTYHVAFGMDARPNVLKGNTYSFTLTHPVPAGGQLGGFYYAFTEDPSVWKVYSFVSPASAAPIETASVTPGAEGAALGTLGEADGDLQSFYKAAYGHNRWSTSAYRQFLNSGAAAGEWWTPQHDYDRPPTAAQRRAGFLSGFDGDFLSCIQPVKVTTALNTVTDLAIGDSEDTYDKFFLPALEQMHYMPAAAGEGASWGYWRRASGSEGLLERHKPFPQMVAFAIENHAAPTRVALRSPHREHGAVEYLVIEDGRGYGGCPAAADVRCTPACVIC